MTVNQVAQTGLPSKSKSFSMFLWRAREYYPYYLMLLPAFLGLILFSYYPMYGIIAAFQKYNPLLGFANSPWVGWANFERVFARPDFWQIFRNTLFISLGKIIFGQLFAILFALLLAEVRFLTFRRLVQSLTYLPYFLSWLVFGGIMVDLLDLNGLVNNFLQAIGLQRVLFLGTPSIFPWTMIATDTLKGFGYGAIVYLAALTAIDPSLHEAASVDGANRFQRMWHVTLPGIAPTIIIMFTLSLGWVLSAGFEQILVMYNPIVYKTGDIIDTFVYRTGLLGFQYSLATAVGLFKSVVGFVLIIIAMIAARRFANYRII